ncbi:hypothetical protein [Catenuloplanes atrovinosus]|uniref:Uncharacterized protein n=1 Tax=Catenuloplanes atrovinosus TaxID=137266 RepID=A0AAE3YPT7_9ACTN|nr:hypothetical protein [Catenuloplanes atrovinosus]MDR7277624.1 hypothetical protein [Catenuloplanes atrovinosus]
MAAHEPDLPDLSHLRARRTAITDQHVAAGNTRLDRLLAEYRQAVEADGDVRAVQEMGLALLLGVNHRISSGSPLPRSGASPRRGTRSADLEASQWRLRELSVPARN